MSEVGKDSLLVLVSVVKWTCMKFHQHIFLPFNTFIKITEYDLLMAGENISLQHYLIFHKGLLHLTLHLPNNITHKPLITVRISPVFFDTFVKHFHLCVEKINGLLYMTNWGMWLCCCALFLSYKSLVQTEFETLIAALCPGDCIIISLTLLWGKFT